MNVHELEDALFSRFPCADAEPWDHVGLSAGDPCAQVGRVCCALDATEANVRLAAARGANVLVAHHPVYLEAPAAFTPAAPDRPASAAAVYTAIGLGVGIISMHTNLDRSLEARDLLPALIGLKAVHSLERPDDAAATGLGALCEEGEAIALGELARRLSSAFCTEPRVWGPADAPVRRVAFLGGSLGGFGEQALAQGADAIVTGEAGYHVAQDLMLRGCHPVLLGHDRSEQPFTRILRDAVIAAGVAAADVDILDPPRQWWTSAKG